MGSQMDREIMREREGKEGKKPNVKKTGEEKT